MLQRLLLQLLLSLLCFSTAAADIQDDLKGVNSQIREKKKLIKQTKSVETKVSSELTVIEKSLKEKESNLAVLDREMTTVEKGIGSTNDQITKNIEEIEKKKSEIARRVSSLYKAGEMGSIRIFFSSGSIPQAFENQRYMKSVIENDKRLFLDYQSRLQQLKQLRESLEREAAKKELLSKKIKVRKNEIEAEKVRKAELLLKVREERKGHQLSLKELQANAHRLQSMVEKLEARSRKSYSPSGEKKKLIPDTHPQPPVADKGFGAQRGRLSLPVSGEIVSRFGKHKHAEFNSFTFNNGITLSAPLNADIRAAYDGEVIFADKFKGYGNMLIIDHGGGYFTLYAHASAITKKVGTQVRKGESVAKVGDTDSPNGAQLYFEIRYQGKPVDPGPWFR